MAKTTTAEKSGLQDPAAREQLLIAAGELMITRRSIDITLSEIAQKSGLNSALVKYYFGSKSGLLLALLRRALAPAMEQLAHLATASLSPQDKLRIHISGTVNNYFRYPYVNHLINHLLVDGPEFGPIIAEEFGRPVAEAQRQILADGVAAGCFKPVDPMLLYFQISGACDQIFFGRYQLAHIFGVDEVDEVMKKQYAEHVYRLIIQGLLLERGGEADVVSSSSADGM